MVTSIIAQYDSTTIKSVAYNYQHKTMLVHFSHASYLYQGVSKTDFEAFHGAESQGRALNEFIKNKYEFEKIHIEDISLAGNSQK
jgi:hypothetical protein